MILSFSILNNQKTELFQKFFVEKTYFADFQIKTVINSLPKLLNIVELTSKYEKAAYSSRLFTITNLWIHIIKFKLNFYLLITPTYYNNGKALNLENDYEILIKQIDELINQCTSHNPHFELNNNNYFITNTESLLNQFNKYFINQHAKLKSKAKSDKFIQMKVDDSRKLGKYLIVGSASAGKSSIIAQFFLNWNQEQIKNIRPTVNKQAHNFKDNLVNHNFNLIDLGGQVQYTEMHLKDPDIFTNVNNLIYVIDLQDTKKIDFTKNYLLDLIEKLKTNNERPFVAIFLHKFDPDMQELLGENVQHWIDWLDQNLKNCNLDYTYYFTSVKDDSAREALARTFLLTLPYWFLTLTIKDDLIIRSLNSLTPIIREVSTLTRWQTDEMINKELYRQSVMFGFATTKIIIQKWIDHLLKKDFDNKVDNHESDMTLILDKTSSSIDMNFKCPLLMNDNYKDLTKFSGICEVTHGLITGLSQFIGLGSVELIETQIRDKKDNCHFKIFI